MVQYPKQKQILNRVSVLITLAPCRTMQIYKVPLRITLRRHSLEAYLGRVYDGLVVLVLHLVLGVHHHHQVRQPHLDGRKSAGEMAEIPGLTSWPNLSVEAVKTSLFQRVV